MNIINEINERRNTVAGFSKIYFEGIYSSIANFRQKKLEVTQDNYYNVAENDTRLDHISFEEFEELVKLENAYEAARLLKPPVSRFSNTPVGEMGGEYKEKIRSITNKALIRRMTQDMCDDAKTITNKNYEMLVKLGYTGKQDSAIPEIVRGNFNLYLREEQLEHEIKGINEAIDRMRYVLKSMSGTSFALDKDLVELYFQDTPISIIRSNLAKMKVRPIQDYREKFLEEFYEEKMSNYFNNGMDVYNVQGKTIKKMMDGTMEVNESVYKKISDLGYDGKTEHPMIRNGYSTYVKIKVLEKTKIEQLDCAKILYEEVTKIPGVKETLEANMIPDSYNVMVGLRDYTKYEIARNQYKKGKISKEEYEEAKAAYERKQRYGLQTRLSPNIRGLKDVKYDPKKDISTLDPE